MKIRAARRDDLDALMALEAAAFRTDRMTRRQMRYHITNDRAFFSVAVCAGDVVGYALVMYRGRSAHLCGLAVAPEAQGQGYARRLLAAAEKDARGRGSMVIRLEVRRAARRVRALYERTGFTAVLTLPAYYSDGAAGVRMEKMLHRKAQ